MKNIAVLGLGYIGLPTAITLAEAGFTVHGFDVNREVVETLKNGKIHIVEPGIVEAFNTAVSSGRLTFEYELGHADVFYISVPTPFRMENGQPKADLSYVESAGRIVGKSLKKGNLVILESTVPPRTTEMLTRVLSETSGLTPDEFYTAHCPERIIPGNLLFELKNNDRIIGSKSAEGAKIAAEIYEQVLDSGKIRITDDITAEMCKLSENTFRDINIAYANELSIICDKLGIDVFELISLANCHPRVNILTPGVGVGGHCIAVDPWFISEQFPEEAQVITAARRRNDSKPSFVADCVERELDGDKSKVVAVLGLTYKADVDDLRESPSIKLAEILRERGYSVVGCEPCVNVPEIHGIRNIPDLSAALGECDFAVLTLAHSAFKPLLGKIKQMPHYDCIGLLR